MRSRSASITRLSASRSSRPILQWQSACTRTRALSSTSHRRQSGRFNRSDFGNQPFTGIYEPNAPTAGPLGGTSNVGAPKVTPRKLKEHLDQFVVGQERAKKVLSTAVYNHYQRIEELKRQQDEYEKLLERRARIEISRRHPAEGTLYPVSQGIVEHDAPMPTASSKPLRSIVDMPLDDYTHRDDFLTHNESDEFPGQQSTGHAPPPSSVQQDRSIEEDASQPLEPSEPSLNLEKSNILILGPSGVGKTLMAKTLAKILDVPFSMSDCTPLTQAGYIGEDSEVVIQRLLAAANYDIAKAESGIICLDEIDKIATARVSHGKDVSGEGVQQALLKIIEGTTVTVQGKNERTSTTTGRERERGSGTSSSFPSQSYPGGNTVPGGNPPGGKNEVYTVRTDNILFICTGAFIGLHKLVMERIAKGSIGFGAPVRAANPYSSQGSHDTTIKIDKSNAHLFKEHIPFWPATFPSTIDSTPFSHSSNAPLPQSQSPDADNDPSRLNTLDLITPADLQKFGLIPELVGRIPVHCAVSPLSENALVRVLTEPRNALLKQYVELFALSNIELRFTDSAIRSVARKAMKLGTGARGLRAVLEQVLAESMFEAPGSNTKYVVITEDVVERKVAAIHLARGQRQLFESLLAQEVDKEQQQEQDNENDFCSFQQYREKVSAVGT